MRVDELMSARVVTVDANAPVLQAANAMRDFVVGILPVLSQGLLVGVVTDRDITDRLVVREQNPRTTRVADVMTTHVATCFGDDDVETAVARMAARAVRRLVVLDRDDGAVAGVLSVDDLARCPDHADWALRVLDRLNRLRGVELDGLSGPAGDAKKQS